MLVLAWMVNNSTNNMQDDNLENVNKHILADNDSSSRAEEFGFTVILQKLLCVSTDLMCYIAWDLSGYLKVKTVMNAYFLTFFWNDTPQNQLSAENLSPKTAHFNTQLTTYHLIKFTDIRSQW